MPDLMLYDPADFTGYAYDALVVLGRQVQDFPQWVLGDLAAAVETTYGKGQLQQYAQEIGVDYSTLRRYRDVSRAYPESARRLALSWSVHHVLAAQHDRAELVAGDPLTVAEARELVKARMVEADPDKAALVPDRDLLGELSAPRPRPPSWKQQAIAQTRRLEEAEEQIARLEAERSVPSLLAELEPDPAPPPPALSPEMEQWVASRVAAYVAMLERYGVSRAARYELGRRIYQASTEVPAA